VKSKYILCEFSYTAAPETPDDFLNNFSKKAEIFIKPAKYISIKNLFFKPYCLGTHLQTDFLVVQHTPAVETDSTDAVTCCSISLWIP
jgi:hypothetical protein